MVGITRRKNDGVDAYPDASIKNSEVALPFLAIRKLYLTFKSEKIR